MKQIEIVLINVDGIVMKVALNKRGENYLKEDRKEAKQNM